MYTDVLDIFEAGEVSSLNVSVNRSGMVRAAPSINEASIQTDPVNVEHVRLRVNQRICTDEVKNTCAILSSTCGISVETARKAVQIVCKNMYGHELYLSAKESGGKDLTHVMQASRTVTDHKQYLATATETDAALALLDKDVSVKAFPHFDTTSRNNIDVNWPSIILRFTNGEEFRLRPMFFACEDREQITLQFSETFKRLAAAASIQKNQHNFGREYLL